VLKPHRVLLSKVGAYTAEASAFRRRRRHHRRAFIRIQYQSGEALDISPESAEAQAINSAVGSLIQRS
jgi:hypothetical protein